MKTVTMIITRINRQDRNDNDMGEDLDFNRINRLLCAINYKHAYFGVVS